MQGNSCIVKRIVMLVVLCINMRICDDICTCIANLHLHQCTSGISLWLHSAANLSFYVLAVLTGSFRHLCITVILEHISVIHGLCPCPGLFLTFLCLKFFLRGLSCLHSFNLQFDGCWIFTCALVWNFEECSVFD